MSREEKLRTIFKTIDMSEYSDTKKNIDKPTCLIKTYKDPQDFWIAANYSKKKYADYKPFQFVDGEGIRCSIYLSGCLFACKECFNESIQNFNVGQEYTKEVEDKIIDDLRHTYVQGLTILGGEPFLNTQVAVSLAKRVREEFGYEKDIWVYSGYTYEQLLNGSEDKKELLSLCDVLVDGPFMIFLKDLSLRFRGSSNQRIIDLKKSTRENVVLYLE
ncbi:anaerobic ribonucleotide reductase-activating protein [Gemella morbillorum]|uniref:anaerobic ribonucleoside-triphosphate reductase activating protein n=1 Tax=Gemella morbillorum TaxID=29391 RepID=UPI000DA3B31C|nr:anaerobic ribonucleoside-triphosphate reductase activating protein [Gemella morbillorum]UBH80509.1 anaerobic ribonucleoside-triphosphate reductase activating protein [Gemella morbillorum]SQH55907.1 anaerobic ribonucleotide reductase-activating protein [Gemella morbillorum]